MNIFEKASRLKLRINTSRGLCSVDDLWDLKLDNSRDGCDLNTIAKNVYTVLKASSAPDFVAPKADATTDTEQRAELTLEILKFIIADRQAKVTEAEREAVRAGQRARLSALIDEKKDKELADKSMDELIAMRDAL